MTESRVLADVLFGYLTSIPAWSFDITLLALKLPLVSKEWKERFVGMDKEIICKHTNAYARSNRSLVGFDMKELMEDPVSPAAKVLKVLMSFMDYQVESKKSPPRTPTTSSSPRRVLVRITPPTVRLSLQRRIRYRW